MASTPQLWVRADRLDDVALRGWIALAEQYVGTLPAKPGASIRPKLAASNSR